MAITVVKSQPNNEGSNGKPKPKPRPLVREYFELVVDILMLTLLSAWGRFRMPPSTQPKPKPNKPMVAWN